MADKVRDSENLNTQELDAIYAISRVVTRASDLDASLDEIIGIARTVFIFDNVVLYVINQSERIEPSYARAIGRGRNSEADLAWGEPIAKDVLQKEKIVVRQEITGDFTKDRMKDRYFLGLPLIAGDQHIGALVFVRYGGPQFTPEHTHLAEYIAGHIAQLYEHGNLVTRLSRLEAERQLERLQDDFVATVSHELRTPLGFIKGYATSLLREDAEWDENTRREFLNIIDEETDRLRELIDNILDSSRLQSGTLRMEFQPVRLDTMLRDLSLRARSFNKELNIEINLETAPLKVKADPTRLVQVFDNLLSNAVKYAPDSTVKITLNTQDDYAHIEFSDQGPGIPAADLPNIFTRFYRVPNQNKSIRGTGLGLFICRRIINAHDGEITAESKFGEGTTFHIFLPILNHNTGEDSRHS
jgi:signal transduction histidine kinase